MYETRPMETTTLFKNGDRLLTAGEFAVVLRDAFRWESSIVSDDAFAMLANMMFQFADDDGNLAKDPLTDQQRFARFVLDRVPSPESEFESAVYMAGLVDAIIETGADTNDQALSERLMRYYQTMSGSWEHAMEHYAEEALDRYRASCCAAADALRVFFAAMFLELYYWTLKNGWEVFHV